MPKIINKPQPKETIIAVIDGIETAISNTGELKKHIQFLLRTDSRQQWTTDKTPDDWIAFPVFDEEALALGDENSRRGLADILSDAVTVILAGENTPLEDDMLENYLYVFALEKIDESGKPVDSPFTLDDRDFIISKFIESPYADLISLVCHRDDESGHEKMHGMFVWTPGKINRIMSVLQDEEDVSNNNENYDENEDEEDFESDEDNEIKPPSDVLER